MSQPAAATSSAHKPAYERPMIVRHQMGLMNKFGRVGAMRPMTHIEGVAVEDLVAKYGSPLFVFSQRMLVARYRELHDAFTRRWPRVRIAWSYKTNYLSGICKTFHKEGAWAEVVSPWEADKARANGIPSERIHWNGPYKPEEAIAQALRGGTMIHLDNLDELARVERVAERLDLRPKVAIRVNMQIEGLPPWSRFGFNLETGQAREAVNRLVAGDRLHARLHGQHHVIQVVHAVTEKAQALIPYMRKQLPALVRKLLRLRILPEVGNDLRVRSRSDFRRRIVQQHAVECVDIFLQRPLPVAQQQARRVELREPLREPVVPGFLRLRQQTDARRDPCMQVLMREHFI